MVGSKIIKRRNRRSDAEYAQIKQDFPDLIDKYLEEKIAQNDKYIDKNIKRVALPSLENFSLWVDVNRRTIADWEQENPVIHKALDKLRATSKDMLINGGLASIYNSAIVKLILCNNHGMKDGEDSSRDINLLVTFTDEQAKRIANRIASRKGTDDNPSGTEQPY